MVRNELVPFTVENVCIFLCNDLFIINIRMCYSINQGGLLESIYAYERKNIHLCLCKYVRICS